MKKFLLFFVLAVVILYLAQDFIIDGAEKIILARTNASWAPEALYILGRGCFITMKYPRAAETFKTAIQIFPKHPWADEAQFWIAESYDRISKKNPAAIPRAIQQYAVFMKKYPAHRWAPDAARRMENLRVLYGQEEPEAAPASGLRGRRSGRR